MSLAVAPVSVSAFEAGFRLVVEFFASNDFSKFSLPQKSDFCRHPTHGWEKVVYKTGLTNFLFNHMVYKRGIKYDMND